MPTAEPSSHELGRLVQASISRRLPAAIALRRKLHAHPETAFEETQTSNIVASYLAGVPYLEVTRGLAGGTGLVATLRGTAPDPETWPHRPVVALRADLDALAVPERTGLPYSSRHPGRMHACGHDLHMAAVATAGAVLSDLRDHLRGDIKLIFQPAEEAGSRPGPEQDPFVEYGRGPSGGQLMIAGGVLESPRVDAIAGLHCWPDLPVGVVGVDPRVAMAGNGVLRVRVRGRGGHGAAPHRTIDPVPVAATIILALQTLVSRYNDPANPFVLSVTTLEAGSVVNVIPEKVELQATLRAVKPGFLEHDIGLRAPEMVRGIAAAFGAGCDVTFGTGYPVTTNDPRLVEAALASVRSALGDGAARRLTDLAMTSEDFAYYAQAVPGVYLKVGVAGPGGCLPLHNPGFAPDEGALPVAITAAAQLALDLCRLGLGEPG